jgi:hypothetical protein
MRRGRWRWRARFTIFLRIGILNRSVTRMVLSRTRCLTTLTAFLDTPAPDAGTTKD